jgi:hypothetical protein
LFIFAFVCLINSSNLQNISENMRSMFVNLRNRNIQIPVYIGRGYDIFYGNPLVDDAIDPGITNGQIFDLTWDNSLKSNDNYYLIPDQAIVQTQTSLSSSTTTNVITSLKKYSEALQAKVQISASYDSPFLKASFSSSAQYSNTENIVSENKEIFVQNCTEYPIYEVNVNGIPKLKQAFVSAVKYAFSQSDWTAFFHLYGTHYIAKHNLGGRFTKTSIFSQQDYTSLVASKIDIQVAMNVLYFGFTGSANGSVESNKQTEEKIKNIKIKKNIKYLGGIDMGASRKFYKLLS